MPGILLGDVFPDFEAETTIGKIKFHEFLGNSWGILFSHPRDFTPVCTTELARAAKLSDEFKKRDVKMIALSIDSVEDHHKWSQDIMAFNQDKACGLLPYPIIADDKRELSVLLGMLDPDEKDKLGMPLTARCVFVIGPDKRLKLSIPSSRSLVSPGHISERSTRFLVYLVYQSSLFLPTSIVCRLPSLLCLFSAHDRSLPALTHCLFLLRACPSSSHCVCLRTPSARPELTPPLKPHMDPNQPESSSQQNFFATILLNHWCHEENASSITWTTAHLGLDNPLIMEVLSQILV
ncbi:peroxiredoxin-6-like [Xyrauchen texanus]|uniref:peroxiredoxin-6-like n=1 Tax=Xyrauchen texanus TaxID=154827 RepID=UPI002242A9EA|nr:peroxiredoxin-6-like [Xyrauchen texanus]